MNLNVSLSFLVIKCLVIEAMNKNSISKICANYVLCCIFMKIFTISKS